MEEVKQMKKEREERKSQIAKQDTENEDDEEEEGISWGIGSIFFLLLDSFPCVSVKFPLCCSNH